MAHVRTELVGTVVPNEMFVVLDPENGGALIRMSPQRAREVAEELLEAAEDIQPSTTGF